MYIYVYVCVSVYIHMYIYTSKHTYICLTPQGEPIQIERSLQLNGSARELLDLALDPHGPRRLAIPLEPFYPKFVRLPSVDKVRIHNGYPSIQGSIVSSTYLYIRTYTSLCNSIYNISIPLEPFYPKFVRLPSVDKVDA